MESNRSWANWLAQLAIIRVGGAVSGLGATYWATAHLSEQAGARFVGYSTALSNGVEAAVALLIGVGLIRGTHRLAILVGVACGFAAFFAVRNPQLESLWIARIADGLIAGVATTSALGAVLAAARDKANGARMIVAFESIVIVAFAIGSGIAAYIWPALGSLIFAVSGGLYMASALWIRQRSTEYEDTRTSIDFQSLRNPILLGVLAISTSASMWVSQTTFVMTSHKVAGQVFPGSMNKAQVAILLVAYLAALSLGLGIWSQILTRMKASSAAFTGAWGAILAPLALLASNLSDLSASLRLIFLGIYIVFLLVQTGLIPAILALVNKPRDTTNPLAISSVFVVATAIGSIIGPLIGGSITASHSFSGLCLASAALASVALASTLPGMKRDKASYSA